MIYIFRDAGCYGTNATNIGQNRTRKIPNKELIIQYMSIIYLWKSLQIESRSWRSKVKRSSFSHVGCHGPEIGPICPCESGLLPVLNGPWELLKLTRMHVEINSIEVYKTYVILFIELSGALEMRRFLGTYIRAQQYEVGIFGPDRNLRWGEFRPPVWKFNNSNSPL